MCVRPTELFLFFEFNVPAFVCVDTIVAHEKAATLVKDPVGGKRISRSVLEDRLKQEAGLQPQVKPSVTPSKAPKPPRAAAKTEKKNLKRSKPYAS